MIMFYKIQFQITKPLVLIAYYVVQAVSFMLETHLESQDELYDALQRYSEGKT